LEFTKRHKKTTFTIFSRNSGRSEPAFEFGSAYWIYEGNVFSILCLGIIELFYGSNSLRAIASLGIIELEGASTQVGQGTQTHFCFILFNHMLALLRNL
jgi:hypothetical protein